MKRDGSFKYVVNSAKKGDGAHGKGRCTCLCLLSPWCSLSMASQVCFVVRTGYIDALVKYGSEKQRYQGYQSRADIEYIRDHTDPTLMTSMGYKMADPAKLNNS